MVCCLFPHCRNSQHLHLIPKLRKPNNNNRGKRKNYEKINSIINDQHYKWIEICKTHIPDFKYIEGSRTMVICINHFDESVIQMNKKNEKVPILGALPTLNLIDGEREVRYPKCVVSSYDDFICCELYKKLDRSPVKTLKVEPRTNRSIKQFFYKQRTREDLETKRNR